MSWRGPYKKILVGAEFTYTCCPSQRPRKQTKMYKFSSTYRAVSCILPRYDERLFLLRHKCISLKMNQFNSIKHCTNTYGKNWMFNLNFKKHTNSHSSINFFTLWNYSYQYFNVTESEWERNGLPKQMAVTDCIPRLRISTQAEAAWYTMNHFWIPVPPELSLEE